MLFSDCDFILYWPVTDDSFSFLRMTGLVSNHVFKLYHQSFVPERLRLLRALRIVGPRLLFRRQNLLQHLPVRLRGRDLARRGCRLATESDDLVGQELSMELLVGHFGQEKLGQLRAIRASGLRCIPDIG
jgi:hypothetical protein